VNSPGRSGWAGLTDVTLGFDRASATNTSPDLLDKLDQFAEAVGHLGGARPVSARGMSASTFFAKDFSRVRTEAIRLVRDVREALATREEGELSDK
jgi:hypothetical protein